MAEVEVSGSGTAPAHARMRVVPASLVGIAPAPYRRGGRTLQLMRLGVAATIWVLLAVALGPVAPSVGDDLAYAASARASYRYDRALTWYAEAMRAAPSDPRPVCLTGDVRSSQREWALAAAAYQRCIGLHPADPASAWLDLGNARSALGNAAGAIVAWQRSIDAGGSEAAAQLGDTYELAGNVNAAFAAWKRLPANDALARAHLGALALWRGDVAAARADFVIAGNQSNASAQALLSQGFVPLAVGDSLDAAAWGKLGYTFLVANRPALALVPLQTAVRLDPANASARAYLGWTLWLLSQRGTTPNSTPAAYATQAQSEIQSALTLDARNSFAWFAAGTLAAAANQLSAASADLAEAASLDGKNPAIWSAAGQVALAQANYLAAEFDFTNAAQFSTQPDESIALLHFYADHGYGVNDGRAMSAAAAVAQRWPASEPVRFLQARIADEAGAPDQATYAAQAALSLDPTDPGPYVLLGSYALQAGEYLTAAGYLRTALALQPAGPWAAQATTLMDPLWSLDV